MKTRAERDADHRSMTWTTKEGQTLAIVDMKDSHLGNTLRFLERRMDEGRDGQSGAAYNTMVAEARRRKLKWRVPRNARCTFEVDGLPQCGLPAVMLAPPASRGDHQAPRCQGRHLSIAITDLESAENWLVRR